MSELRVVPFTEKLSSDLVEIHQSAYEIRPNLTYYLGNKFVSHTFSFFYGFDDAYGVVAYEGSEPVGFCVGASYLPFGSLNRYRQFAALKALLGRPWLWFHPEVGIRLVKETLFRKSEEEPSFPGAPYCFIYSIAVVPGASGKGVGKKLLDGFEKLGKSKALHRCIIPIGPDNTASIRMAEGRGYRKLNDLYFQGNIFLELTS